MKRTHLHLALISIPGLLIVSSCDSDEEKITPPEYRVSWIASDDSYQLFEYDASGRISEWIYDDSSQSPSWVFQSTYRYLDDEDAILITSQENRGSDIWSFNEKLHLSQHGTASHATGDVTIMKDGELLLLKKNYTVDFQYNSSHQLTKLNIVEKIAGDNGPADRTGLEWFIELEWDENNLTKHSEYSNAGRPTLTKTFTYFGGNTTHYRPIVQGPILRHYYLPLQYQGILGLQSIGLVKDEVVSSQNMSYSSTFSYDISSSVYSSAVEEYSESRNDKAIKYIVAWESYKK